MAWVTGQFRPTGIGLYLFYHNLPLEVIDFCHSEKVSGCWRGRLPPVGQSGIISLERWSISICKICADLVLYSIIQLLEL
jgi:hypothetical protein